MRKNFILKLDVLICAATKIVAYQGPQTDLKINVPVLVRQLVNIQGFLLFSEKAYSVILDLLSQQRITGK